MHDSSKLTLDDFKDLLNEDFVLGGELRGHSLTLVEVSPLQQSRADEFRKPFALLFQSSFETPLGQGSYSLSHDRLRSVEIFLVPVGPGREGLLYEAIFN